MKSGNWINLLSKFLRKVIVYKDFTSSFGRVKTRFKLLPEIYVGKTV